MIRDHLAAKADGKVVTTAVLGSAIALVAASTAALPYVRGYGTTLFQFVALGAAAIVESMASSSGDGHLTAVWLVALLVNLASYLIPLVLLHLFKKRASASLRVGVIFVWTVFYLAALFVLFPARDGP